MAISYNFKNAVYGEYPDFKIDFPKVILAAGHLPKLKTPAVSCTEPGKIEFCWSNSAKLKMRMYDIVWALAYCEEMKEWVCAYPAGDRKGQYCVLNAKQFSGYTVYTYIGVVSCSLKSISKSMYAGSVKVL